MKINKYAIGTVILMLVGCGGNKELNLTSLEVQAPTMLKSVNDFPQPITSRKDIVKTGMVRVIAESAKNQDRYDAVRAAEIEAESGILLIVHGADMNVDQLASSGVLTKDEVSRLANGHLRTFNCGNFYDSVAQVGYSCMEAGLK